MRLDSASLSPNLLTLGMGPIETNLVYEIKYFISKIHARNDRPRKYFIQQIRVLHVFTASPTLVSFIRSPLIYQIW